MPSVCKSTTFPISMSVARVASSSLGFFYIIICKYNYNNIIIIYYNDINLLFLYILLYLVLHNCLSVCLQSVCASCISPVVSRPPSTAAGRSGTYC